MISPIMIHYPYRENRCVRRALRLRLRYVGASSSRVPLARLVKSNHAKRDDPTNQFMLKPVIFALIRVVI